MNKKQGVVVAIAMIIVAVIVLGAILSPGEEEKPPGLKVVATFYPLAYFSEQLGGEHVVVDTLIPYNTEVHSWQPSPSDIQQVEEADIFIYNGAGLEPWVEDSLLPAIKTEGKIIVECTHGLELLPTSDIEDDHEADDGHDHDHGVYDPHTWIDPVIAKGSSMAILNAFILADPANASSYNESAAILFDKFDSLDSQYSASLASKQKDMIIVTHKAYRYLGHRYNFELEGVVGISADEQPSAATMAELAGLMEENDIYVLFTDPVYASDYADALKSTVEEKTGHDVEVLPLYLMTGPSSDGLDYFGQQEANLNNLIIGLEAS